MRIVDRLSKEVKKEIIQLYMDSSLPTKEICMMYGFGQSALMDIINEANVPYRRPNMVGSRSKNKGCPFCGSKMSPKGSKFCCECGKPLYTEKELIIKHLEKLTEYFIVLENAKRDDYIAEINSIISEVKKLEVIENE